MGKLVVSSSNSSYSDPQGLEREDAAREPRNIYTWQTNLPASKPNGSSRGVVPVEKCMHGKCLQIQMLFGVVFW